MKMNFCVGSKSQASLLTTHYYVLIARMRMSKSSSIEDRAESGSLPAKVNCLVEGTYRFEDGMTYDMNFPLNGFPGVLTEDRMLEMIWNNLTGREQNKLVDVICKQRKADKFKLAFLEGMITYGSGFIRMRVDGTNG